MARGEAKANPFWILWFAVCLIVGDGALTYLTMSTTNPFTWGAIAAAILLLILTAIAIIAWLRRRIGGMGEELAFLWIWFVHVVIAAVLSAPIMFFGGARVQWHAWELLALVLPFGVWTILIASPLAKERA